MDKLNTAELIERMKTKYEGLFETPENQLGNSIPNVIGYSPDDMPLHRLGESALKISTPSIPQEEYEKYESIRKDIQDLLFNFYSLQKERLSTQSRIRSILLTRHADKTEDLPQENQGINLFCKAYKEYQLFSEVYSDTHNSISKHKKACNTFSLVFNKAPEFLNDYGVFTLFTVYESISKNESDLELAIKHLVERYPLWDRFFKNVKGCGTLMAAVCISEFDICKAKYASSMRKYAGLDTVIVLDHDNLDEFGNPTFKGEGRTRKHCELYEYVDKNGEIKVRKGITYNSFLKSKLVKVLGDCLIRARGQYYLLYKEYSFRLDQRADAQNLKKIVKHRRAVRYMLKIFLQNLYVEWRVLYGLPVYRGYEEVYLKKTPHGRGE